MEVEVAFMSRNVGLPDESDSESESDGARRSDSHESSSPPPHPLSLSPSAMQAPLRGSFLLACAQAAVHLLLLPASAAADPADAVIRSGVPWYDTDGNRMFAGGANMYVEDGVYYLIGEGKKVLSGVSMRNGARSIRSGVRNESGAKAGGRCAGRVQHALNAATPLRQQRVLPHSTQRRLQQLCCAPPPSKQQRAASCRPHPTPARPPAQDISACFNLYSTTDLQAWKFEGCALNNRCGPHAAARSRCRPPCPSADAQGDGGGGVSAQGAARPCPSAVLTSHPRVATHSRPRALQ